LPIFTNCPRQDWPPCSNLLRVRLGGLTWLPTLNKPHDKDNEEKKSVDWESGVKALSSPIRP
jgi:hypothetical protein